METSDPARWQRIEALIEAVVDLPPADRDRWLRDTCGEDVELYSEVRALLEAGERTDGFLESPIGWFAERLGEHDALPELPAGQKAPPRVGPYRIVREIGRGGMGTVYLAERDEHFEQRVALKVVRRGLHVDEQLIRRFVEERQMLASLEHANISRLIDGGLTDEGLPWFAMEFVEGDPIDRWCDERRLQIEARLELFATVCDAVDYAHRRRIVHRDLKPSNVMVRADGTVKLLDFGIAKLLAPDRAAADRATRPGLRFLTPDYASPEQIRGGTVSPGSDVYSLGVLLYELLSGRSPNRDRQASSDPSGSAPTREPEPPSVAITHPDEPAESGTGAEVHPARTATGIARDRGTTPERLKERLRGQLDHVVLKALSSAVDRRYPTAGALAQDIRRYLEGLPVNARRPGRLRQVLPRLIAASLVVAVATALWMRFRERSPGLQTPMLAVGLIADHRGTGPPGIASPVADLLSTNLARIPGLRVISTARLYELMTQLGSTGQPDPGAYPAAARRAGATMLVDGSLYTVGDHLRLDLRRIDLATGEVLAVDSISAVDLFVLVDSGTARLANRMGTTASIGSVADVTTHSEAAYRFYQEGVRAHYRGDQPAARGLLEAALREDSALAMASYFLARLDPNTEVGFEAMERALRMASRASERERLIIRTAWAVFTSDPGAIESAETLIARYPEELDGQFFAAKAFSVAGDFAAAIPRLRQVITVDSIAGAGARLRCTGCDARLQLIDTYMYMDSLAAAEREALVWTRFEPERATAWLYLSRIRSLLGESEAAFEAYNRAAGMDATLIGQPSFLSKTWLTVGEYERVDRELQEITRSGAADRVPEAWWYLTLSFRQQGRLREALNAALACRMAAPPGVSPLVIQTYELHHAQVLYELGRYVESAALFDSIAGSPVDLSASNRARIRAWTLSLGANGLSAIGDTARIIARIDTIRQVGSGSLAARDRLLYHHVQALVLASRGDDEGAAAEFRLALSTPTGYTRTHYELGRVLLRLGRPGEAVTAMQPAVRAPMEGSALYVTTTERRALLAEAWDAAGQPDSALTHYRIVLRAWQRADPQFAPRVEAIRARISALEAVTAGTQRPGGSGS